MEIDTTNIDIIENNILTSNKNLLSILLMDRSTNKNIVWATDDYIAFGKSYAPESEITIDEITGIYSYIITPRVMKEKQSIRTRNKAEVFTPSWICNEQNNLVDEQWFGRADVFNTTSEKSGKPTERKLFFRVKSDTPGRIMSGQKEWKLPVVKHLI